VTLVHSEPNIILSRGFKNRRSPIQKKKKRKNSLPIHELEFFRRGRIRKESPSRKIRRSRGLFGDKGARESATIRNCSTWIVAMRARACWKAGAGRLCIRAITRARNHT